jgi:ferritin
LEQNVLQLIKLIGEEVVIFSTFLEYLNQQQEALVANDLEGLERVTAQQEELAQRTNEIEQQRKQLVARISNDLHRNEDDLNLTELTKLVSAQQSEELHTLQETLLNLHSQISEQKSQNDFLIRKSMEYINGTMVALGLSNAAQSQNYTADPAPPKSTRAAALVDRRA